MTKEILDAAFERYHPEAKARRQMEFARQKASILDVIGLNEEDLMSVLNPRQKEILFMRFGLDGARRKTLKEVAEHFGRTKETIRQQQNIAIYKLRDAIQRQQILF